MSFKNDLSVWDQEKLETWLKDIEVEKLTSQDKKIWEEYKKIIPGEESGSLFLEKILAPYAELLLQESRLLQETGADNTINKNSRKFHHFLSNKYMIDSANTKNKKAA